MKRLSVSHIAWPPDQEEKLLAILNAEKVEKVELAPVRAFGNPLIAQEAGVRAKAEWYRRKGFRIGSFQALLYGSGNLFLFEDEAARSRLKDWLVAVGRVAGWCGAGPMVFGSPKNRLKGSLTHTQAITSAAPFFREVGDACAASGSVLVMEANPAAYGADFCTCLSQAAELVALAASPGFKLHVDAGGLALSSEEFEVVVRQSGALIGHVHASQPNLADWEIPHPVHGRLATALRKSGYGGDIAIEMRMQEHVAAAVVSAIRNTAGIYLQA